MKKNLKGNIETYDETQILNNTEVFYTKIFNQSFFESEKIIIINRCSEKLYEVIKNLKEKKISDIKIIFNATILDKKSKLRSLFEKSDELIKIPTYKDTPITLMEIAKKFFNNYKITISQETINLLVNRCNGDR